MTEESERAELPTARETQERSRKAEELLEELLAAHDARALSDFLEIIGNVRRFLATR